VKSWPISPAFLGRIGGATKLAKVSDDQLSAMEIPTLIYNIVEDLADRINVANHLEDLTPNSVREFIPYGAGLPAWECPDWVNS
jgi:hypothetical protein